jgi:hypothetical protein
LPRTAPSAVLSGHRIFCFDLGVSRAVVGAAFDKHAKQRINERNQNMKTMTKAVLAMLALGASTWVIIAQQDNGPGPGGQGGNGGPPPGRQGGPGARRPLPPVFLALDTNHDGVIDANEIANAPAALKTLLKNGATTLTPEDLLGPPMRRGGPGGFGGPGGPGGPGGRGPGGPDGPGGGGPPPDDQ